jgi:hypothetical protein
MTKAGRRKIWALDPSLTAVKPSTIEPKKKMLTRPMTKDRPGDRSAAEPVRDTTAGKREARAVRRAVTHKADETMAVNNPVKLSTRSSRGLHGWF